jgi:hypothetical protein
VKPIGTSLDAVKGLESALLFRNKSRTFSQNLSSFLLRDALDLFQHPPRSVGYRFDSIVASVHNQLNISFC